MLSEGWGKTRAICLRQGNLHLRPGRWLRGRSRRRRPCPDWTSADLTCPGVDPHGAARAAPRLRRREARCHVPESEDRPSGTEENVDSRSGDVGLQTLGHRRRAYRRELGVGNLAERTGHLDGADGIALREFAGDEMELRPDR